MTKESAKEAATKAKKQAAKMKAKDITNLEIQVGDEIVNVDLTKQCPQDLLETAKYVATPYIPIKLIRKIGRKLWRKVVVENCKYEITWSGMLIQYQVKVITEDDIYDGEAIDFIGANSVKKSLDGQSSRVKALAIKDALKWVYPFFDINFDEADAAMNQLKDTDGSLDEVGPSKPTVKPTTTTKPKEDLGSSKVDAILEEMQKFDTIDKLKMFIKASSETIKNMSELERTTISNEYKSLVEKLG